MTEQTVARQDSSAADMPLSPAWKLGRNTQQDAPKSALIGPFSELAERTASGKLPGAADPLAGGLLAPGGSFSRPDKWGAGTDAPPVLRPVVLGGAASSAKWREEEREKVQPAGNGALPAAADRWTATADHPATRRVDPAREPWVAGRGRGRGEDGRWGAVANKDTNWSNLPGMPIAERNAERAPELADKRTFTLERWDSGAPGAGGSFTTSTWRAGAAAAAPGAPPAAGARGFTGRGRSMVPPAPTAAAGGPTAPGAPGRWVSPSAEAKKYTAEQLKGVAENMLAAGAKMPMPHGTSLPAYTDVRAYDADSTRRALNGDFTPPSDAVHVEGAPAATRSLSYTSTQGPTPDQGHANGSWGHAAGTAGGIATEAAQQGNTQQKQEPADEGLPASHAAAHPPPGMAGHPGGPAPAVPFISHQQYLLDKWVYRDPQNVVQGPFPRMDIMDWTLAGYFPDDLPVRSAMGDPNTWWPLAAMRRAWAEWEHKVQAHAAMATPPAPTTPQVLAPQQQPVAGFGAVTHVQEAPFHQPQPHTPYLHAHAQQPTHGNVPGGNAFLGGGAAPAPQLGGVSGFAGWGMGGSPWGAPDAGLGGGVLGTPGVGAGEASVAHLKHQAEPSLGLSTPTTQASLPNPLVGAAAAPLWGQPDMGGLHAAPQLDNTLRTASLPGVAGLGPNPLVPGRWGDHTPSPPVWQAPTLANWQNPPNPDAHVQGQQLDFGYGQPQEAPAHQPTQANTLQDSAVAAAALQPPMTSTASMPAALAQQSEGAPATAAAPQPAPAAVQPQPAAQQPHKAKAAATPSQQAPERQLATAASGLQAAAPAASAASQASQPQTSADQDVVQDVAAVLNRVAPWAGKGQARGKTLKEIQEEEAAAAAARAAEVAAAAAARAAAEGAAVAAVSAQPGSAWARPAAPAAAAWGAAAAAVDVDEAVPVTTTPPVLAAAMAGARKAGAAAAAPKEAVIGTGPGPRATTLAEIFDKKLPGGGNAAPAPAWGGAVARVPMVPKLRDVMTFEESAMDMEGGALDEDLTDVLSMSAPAVAKAAPPPPPPPAKAGRAAAVMATAASAEQDQLFWDYSAAPGTSVTTATAPPPPPPAAKHAGPAIPGATLAARLAGTTAAAPAAKPAAAAGGPWAAATNKQAAAAPASAWGAATPAAAPAIAARAAAAPAAAGTIKVIKPAQPVAPATPAAVKPSLAPTADASATAVADKMSPEFWTWAHTAWSVFNKGDPELLRWLVSLSCRSEISDYILHVVGANTPGVGAFVAEFLKRKEAEEARIANPGKNKKKGAAAQQDKPGSEWQAAVKQPAAKKGAGKGAAAQPGGKGGRANGFALLMQ